MSAVTSIEWTDRSWNPVTGCSKISPGCAHCYAEAIARRFWSAQYGDRAFEEVRLHEERLDEPRRWREPQRVFVNSMSDLFHEDVPFGFVDRVFLVMQETPQHTFQVLTKRAARMRDYMQSRLEMIDLIARAEGQAHFWPPVNVWLGVSIENQRFANERIPELLRTPAALRFLSLEPLLGPVDLLEPNVDLENGATVNAFRFEAGPMALDLDTLPRIRWVIVGFESGPGARAGDVLWARAIVAQCHLAGCPVFVKQLGARPRGIVLPRRGLEGKGGNPEAWPADLRVREFP